MCPPTLVRSMTSEIYVLYSYGSSAKPNPSDSVSTFGKFKKLAHHKLLEKYLKLNLSIPRTDRKTIVWTPTTHRETRGHSTILCNQNVMRNHYIFITSLLFNSTTYFSLCVSHSIVSVCHMMWFDSRDVILIAPPHLVVATRYKTMLHW